VPTPDPTAIREFPNFAGGHPRPHTSRVPELSPPPARRARQLPRACKPTLCVYLSVASSPHLPRIFSPLASFCSHCHGLLAVESGECEPIATQWRRVTM